MQQTSVTQYLDEHQIPYTFFAHPGPVHSLAQAAAERQQTPEQVVRSILFRLANDTYLMVLMAGPQQIDWKALRSYVGQSRLTMAKPEQVLAVTGYEIGSVSPFGLPQPLRVLVDESVTRQTGISIGSGIRSATIFMTTADLLQALDNPEIVALAKD